MGWLRDVLTPSREKFARKVAAQLRAAGAGDEFEYQADANRLVAKGEKRRVVNLNNPYVDYCEAPFRQRKRVLAQYVSSYVNLLPGTPETWAEAKETLLPRIRDRFHQGEVRLGFQIDGATPLEIPGRDLAGRLRVEMVCDLAQAMGSVTQKMLQTWGVSFDDALAVARDNLWRRSNDAFEQPMPGLFVSPWRDNHDASRLVLHDLIWQLPVSGDHVAIVPTRDMLIVTGSNNEAGLRRMFEMAEAAFGDRRSNEAGAVRLDGSNWVSLDLPAQHPAHVVARNFDVQVDAMGYNRQKGLLDTLHKKRKEDVFAATLQVFTQPETGRHVSSAVWTNGATILLPRAELIIFVKDVNPEGEADTHIAQWHEAVRRVGHKMHAEGLNPERWRVREFPTDEELKSIPSAI